MQPPDIISTISIKSTEPKLISTISAQGLYDHLMVDLRDPRVDAWPLMTSIWPTLTICGLYVYTVKVAGPR